MSTDTERLQWATQEFACAQLGNSLRTQRAIQMASALCAHPAGTITEVFCSSAQRLGAFRFVESDHFCTSALAQAAHRAAVLRCLGFSWVYIALDQSELSLKDTRGSKGLGQVGTLHNGATGLQVLNSLAISPEALPLGLVGQHFWARSVGKKQPVKARRDKLPEQKETGLWMNQLQETADLFEQQAPTCWPWYQLDRGADAWPVLWMSLGLRGLVTVRAAWDRRLWRHPAQEQQYLFGHLGAQEPVGSYLLDIPAGPIAASGTPWCRCA